MASPTAPTLATLTTEALKKTGRSSPTSTELTRAQDYFMEEIKNDIFTRAKDLRSLMTQTDDGVIITAEGDNKYSFPTDYVSLLSAALLYGDNTGTAQAGAAGTITLAAADSFSSDWMKGKKVLITSGTGAQQIRQCTAYNNTTKVATVADNWTTNPDNTSVYMIVDVQYPLTVDHIQRESKEYYPTDKHKPTKLMPIGDEDEGEFILFHTPDDIYGVFLRYYANLMEIDLSGTLMTKLYSTWRNLWIQGVYARQLQDDDDNRAAFEMQVYKGMLSDIIMREQYGTDLSELSTTCEQ